MFEYMQSSPDILIAIFRAKVIGILEDLGNVNLFNLWDSLWFAVKCLDIWATANRAENQKEVESKSASTRLVNIYDRIL